MKFIVAAMALVAVNGIKLQDGGLTEFDMSTIDVGHKHPVTRWTENKIDNLFPEHFNTVPRGDSEWQSSGPEAFKVPAAVPSVDY